MHSFGFWQQGVAPGDWSREVIARNLEGEDFKGYRRASDPSSLRDTGSLLPDVKDAHPDEIVVETGSVVTGQASEETIAAVGRLVAAYGEDNARGEIDADALVQPTGVDLYEVELVDTVAGAAQRAGLDPELVIGAISKGAAQSWQMENRWETMVAGKFDYGFAIDWMRKDLRITLDEAGRNGATLPVTAQVDQFYADVQAMGGNRWDTSSLIARLERPDTKSDT